MSMAKRALEDLPEFAEVAEPEPEFVALPYDEEGVDCIIECDYGFPSIEDDYDWIRTGC